MQPFPITPVTVNWDAVKYFRDHPESIFRPYPSDEEIVALAWLEHPDSSISDLFYVAEYTLVPPPPLDWFTHPAANQRDTGAQEHDHASLGCLLAANLAGFPEPPTPAEFAELLRGREPTAHQRDAMYQFFCAIEVPDLYFLQCCEALTLRELVAALHQARGQRRGFSRSLAQFARPPEALINRGAPDQVRR